MTKLPRWFFLTIPVLIIFGMVLVGKSSPGSTPVWGQGLSQAGVAKLVGRWLRPDSGYVIEIKEIKPDGTMTAAYFNPRPIHVAEAKATVEDCLMKIFVRMQDEGYPGSAYTLNYDKAQDQLQGTYFHAPSAQTFPVSFHRMK